MTPSPLIALRYDVWPEIGLGHLRRGYSLAKELKNRGIACRHVVPERSAALLRRDGIPEHEIVICSAINASWLQDRPEITHVVTDIHWHGNADAASAEVSRLAATGTSVIVVDCVSPDSYIDQTPAPAAVITPYLNARSLRDTPPRNTDWQTGARFSILAPEYETWRARAAQVPTERILVTCGGSDPDGFSIETATALLGANTPLDVVVGPLFSDAIQTALATLADENDQITLHQAPPTLAPLIAQASGIVGRLGLIRYEAACLGKNGIYLSAGTTYRAYLEGFKARGFAEVFLDGAPNGRKDYLDRLRQLADPTRRQVFFKPNSAAMELVDGKGAANVIDVVLSHPTRK